MSQEKVAERFLSHLIINFTLFCMPVCLESFAVKIQFCDSQPRSCTRLPRYPEAWEGLTLYQRTYQIIPLLFIYKSITINSANIITGNPTNIQLLTAQYYFPIKKVLIKSGLQEYNLYWQNCTNCTSIKSLGEITANLEDLILTKGRRSSQKKSFVNPNKQSDNNLVTSVSLLETTGKPMILLQGISI